MKKERKFTDMNFLEKFVSKFDRIKFIMTTVVFAFIMTIISFFIIITRIGPDFLGSWTLLMSYFIVIYLVSVRYTVDLKKKTKAIEDLTEKFENKLK